MRYLILDGTETPDDLREAITGLRARQKAAVIASTRDEYARDIDELLDMLTVQTAPIA